MRKPKWQIEDEARAAEIVKIDAPIICKAVAGTLFIAACAVWVILAATQVPA